MPRGGRRSGTPGKAYPNRTDLAGKAVPNQPYGEAGAQLAAQKAVPMGSPALPPAGAPSGPSAPLPGALGPLDRPSDRPAEPVTAGLTQGAGPGPVFGAQPQSDESAQLRAIYALHPSEDLRELIELLDEM